MAKPVAGRSVKVFIGDVDVTELVHGIQITADVGSVLTTRLELWCGIEFKDGVLRLHGAPMPGRLAAPVIRAMILEGVIPGGG